MAPVANGGEEDPRARPETVPITNRLLRLAAGARGWIALGTTLTLLVTATYVGQGVAVASGLAQIFNGGHWRAIAPSVAIALALLALRSVLLWIRERVTAATGSRIKARLRRRLCERLFQLGPGYTAGARTGGLQAVVVDGVEKVEVYFSRFLPQLLGTVLAAAAILAGLMMVDAVVGSVLLAGAFAIACTPLLARRLQAERARGFWNTWRRLGADYLDALQGMPTLKAFNGSTLRGRQLACRSQEFYRASIGFVRVANLRTGAMGLLSTGGAALAVGLGTMRLASGGRLTPFGLLLVLLLAREAFRPLEDLQKAYHSAYPALSAASGIFRLLDATPTVAEPPSPQPASRAGRIVFDRVTFAYGPSRSPVLKDLTLHIDEGETVGLVGRSGTGKSTIVALLLRFFDPQVGRITLGGHDLVDLSLADLRRHIAVVAQDTYLFHGTVRDNLLLGNPSATGGQIESAARDARAHAFIERLPRGYDTIVGERGLTLSGGERQRIAIARALLKNAPILVLDEATSSIDAANEATIQAALDRLAIGRTTLVIAHRLSSVRNADRIVMLEDGAVSAAGAHASLLAHSAGYARLVGAQVERAQVQGARS